MARPVVITKRKLIREVPDTWAKQYHVDLSPPENTDRRFPDKAAIYKELLKLNLETCSTNDIDNVIGNHSWTANICNGCGADVDTVVVVGEEQDYESSTASLCRNCLVAALELLDKSSAR